MFFRTAIAVVEYEAALCCRAGATIQNASIRVQIIEDAFFSKGNWYKVYFRCEVDAKVTKITSFSFSVGDVIPRSQWTPKMINAVSN